jgi:hypothetical protein
MPLSKLIGGPAFAKMIDTGAFARQIAAAMRPPALELLTSSVMREAFDLQAQQRLVFGRLGEGLLVQQFAALDKLTPAMLLGPELMGTARLAKLFASGSVLAGARSSLLAAHQAQLFAVSSQFREQVIGASLLRDLVDVSSVSARLSSLAAHSLPIFDLLTAPRSWPSSLPTVRVSEFIADLDDSSDATELEVAVSANFSVASLLTFDLGTHDIPPEQYAEAQERFSTDVLPPWMRGPVRASAELYTALHQVAPKVPDLLTGAWDDIARDGAAAAFKIGGCAVEALEWTLRALAPDEDVLAWYASPGRPVVELDSRDRPTYATRVRWILREPEHKGHRRLITVQVEALVTQSTELRSRFQASKHAGQGDVEVLRAYVVALEAVLHQLVLLRR